MDFQPTLYIASSELTRQLRAGVEFEVQKIKLPRWVSRNQVRRLLTEQAQHDDWELSRVRRYRDGSREIWLRRKIIRARLTVFA
ncbi:hypothetical protein SAMN05443377_101223 [Propionibacterium cyclohexanicum]|uniref:Uncharacterized protein n=1 Tax=Propionibacterium cyclohexanicum TaxID=64702 RepID=A0A1H9PSN6_9ACTN|nr:DUF5703 family protein [Propionibacterium cyclohexanicum]SER50825.1 hypothetical protein SAMN05443377_101223 [Propionibacterium cyclohexanicum]